MARSSPTCHMFSFFQKIVLENYENIVICTIFFFYEIFLEIKISIELGVGACYAMHSLYSFIKKIHKV